MFNSNTNGSERVEVGKMKIKGIKNAVSEINNNRQLCHNVVTDGVRVWVDSFADQNSWNSYIDKSVRCIGSWINYPLCYDNIKMLDIKKMLEESRGR